SWRRLGRGGIARVRTPQTRRSDRHQCPRQTRRTGGRPGSAQTQDRVKTPIRIGIIGMGGFAGWHHNTIARLEERNLAKLVCTCDPHAAAFTTEQQTWRLSERGVCIFPDYRQMLDACGKELDLLVVPTPINLHAEMHRAGVEAGIPVYLEKPP